MCGIAGVFLPKKITLTEAHRHSLTVMKDFMKERGPDGSGMMVKPSVGMVHTRLSIIDINERSNQPMESEHWLLTYNGEIVNYRAIRAELEDKYQFHTESDTEVLLFALEEWGIEQALSRCAGMFAFLAYDKRSGEFFAARDPLGIKPLFCYKDEAGAFWLASTPATLKAGQPQKSWEPYKPAIGSFFILGAPFTRMSTTKGIEQIPPAHYCKIAPDGSLSLKRYWSPQFQPDFTMDNLIEIVKEYGHSDVKSALFMSGGIDSTFLASIIRNLDYFHLKSPEQAYAQQVSRKYGRKMIVVDPDWHKYGEGLKKVKETFGEMFMSCGIPYTVANEVVSHGYKMAISANGADELFYGYPRTPMVGLTQLYNRFDSDANKWFSRQVSHIFRDKRHFSIPAYDEYIPDLNDLAIDLIKHCTLTDFSPSASYRWLEIMTYVANDLNPTLDAASMANSLEVRVPFLDHRIVQGVLSWPDDKLYTTELGRKAPLKQRLLQDFNKKFISRPKLGFSIDDKALSAIVKNVDMNFDRMLSTGFIRMNEAEADHGYYGRDLIYMKNICQIYQEFNAAEGSGSMVE